MNWYNVWQQRHVFAVETNILKKRQLVFTPFIKTNQEGFLNADFRSNLYIDSLARYYRYRNLNVLANPGFDTLAYSSFMESKLKNRELNDKIYLTYLTELEKLNVGYQRNKVVNTRSKEAIYLIQQIFLYLYQKGLISRKEMPVYRDADNRLYDEIELEHKTELVEEEVFTLNYAKYVTRIVKHIKDLSVSQEIKDVLMACFKEYSCLKIDFTTRNSKVINIFLPKPEELGALNAIVISPKYCDILEYIAPEEIFAVENFLIRNNKPFLYTGNYVINPLTGKEIPLFISFRYDMTFKPLYSTQDIEALEELDVPINSIYAQDGTLINSDFLNGLSKEEARLEIVKVFAEEGMAEVVYNYLKTDIVISSNDTYGAIFPLANLNGEVITLEKYIPIYFNESFRKVITNETTLPLNAEILEGSLNSLFCHGVELILAIIYDNMADIKNVFARENIKELDSWLNNVTLVVKKQNILDSLLVPIIILSILEAEEGIELLKNLEIVITDNLYDSYGNQIKKAANNCIKINDLIASYGADAIRFYYFSTPIQEPFYFDENKIFAYKQFLNKIKAIFNKGFLASNYNLEFPLYQLKNKLYDALVSLNLTKYSEELIEFVKNYLEQEQLTKKQAGEFLVLLSIVAPYFAEELHYSFINNRELLIDVAWPI